MFFLCFFAFKRTNFAQILKKITQMCVLTSSAFRSSDLSIFKGQSNIAVRPALQPPALQPTTNNANREPIQQKLLDWLELGNLENFTFWFVLSLS